MAIKVLCLLCQDRNKTVEIQSKLISKSKIEEMNNIGLEMAEHLKLFHNKELMQMVNSMAPWNGFNVLKYFIEEKEDSEFEEEKESMRDKLCEMVMYGAPEEDEEFDEEVTGGGEMFDEEDDEDEDEIEEMPLVKQIGEVKS